MRKLLFFVIVLFALNGCQETDKGTDSTAKPNASTATKAVSKKDKASIAKEIAAAQGALYESEPYNFDATKAQNLVNAYEQFYTNFPDDPKTPEYLFSSGELFRSLKKYQKEIDAYQTIIDKHPNYEKTPQSLFLLGFCYENNLGNMKKAENSYKDFLSKYPKHEMAKAAEFSLNNLGRDPADIIKDFEEKNKKGKK